MRGGFHAQKKGEEFPNRRLAGWVQVDEGDGINQMDGSRGKMVFIKRGRQDVFGHDSYGGMKFLKFCIRPLVG